MIESSKYLMGWVKWNIRIEKMKQTININFMLLNLFIYYYNTMEMKKYPSPHEKARFN